MNSAVSTPRPSHPSVASADVLSTAHLCDVGPMGLAMDPAIGAIWPGGRISGPALTVKVAPGDNAPLHESIEKAAAGDILVVDGGAFAPRSLWGAIMSHAAMLRGIAGLVVDGAVRDVAEITEMRFPIFARSRTPVGPYNKVRGSIGAEITCGGLRVRSGDTIVGDDDGVVVLPSDAAAELLELARRRAIREETVVRHLDDGEPFSVAVQYLRPEGR